MGVVEQLTEGVVTAAHVEELVLPPENPTWFHKTAARIITEVQGYEYKDRPILWAIYSSETSQRLLPLVDLFTESRSIAEFQELKIVLLEIMWDYNPFIRRLRDSPLGDYEERAMGEIVEWFPYLLPTFGIFSSVQMETLEIAGPQAAWDQYEEIDTIPFRPVAEKIITPEQTIEVADAVRNQDFPGRVGYIVGKFRLGPHSEHGSLFENAKIALGIDGALFADLESREGIWDRRGNDHIVLWDDERLAQVAGLQAVDYAVMHDPSGLSEPETHAFWERVQRGIDPSFWFVGSKDYHWFKFFEERAKRMGAILFWDKPTTTISTTLIIDAIRAAKDAQIVSDLRLTRQI